jgi:hypothetical protein
MNVTPATKAALVAIAQLLPAGLAAPLLSAFVDHHGAGKGLLRGYWAQSATLAATAALMLAAAPNRSATRPRSSSRSR